MSDSISTEGRGASDVWSVLLLDLKGQFAALKPEIMAAIEVVCDK